MPLQPSAAGGHSTAYAVGHWIMMFIFYSIALAILQSLFWRVYAKLKTKKKAGAEPDGGRRFRRPAGNQPNPDQPKNESANDEKKEDEEKGSMWSKFGSAKNEESKVGEAPHSAPKTLAELAKSESTSTPEQIPSSLRIETLND